MKNWFQGLDSTDLSKLLNDFLTKSKEKRAYDEDSEDDVLAEGYRMLSGRLEHKTEGCSPGVYNNIMLPAWKSFAPSHGGSKQPDPIVRALMPSKEKLAQALQALIRYCVDAFDYTTMTMLCGMDSFFQRGGIGYARHTWNESKGIAETKRFDPKNVFWEAGASSVEKASHVIERHVLKRGEFIKKFGAKKGWNAEAHKGSKISWPKTSARMDGKTEFDDIEYFLFWSKEGGYKRVYAFTKRPKEDGILNKDDGELGEPWPIELPHEDWHLTPLVFTPIPGRIEGVSTYWASRDQYIAYQRLNRSVFFSALKSGKVVLFYPDDIESEMEAVEESGKTITPVPYSKSDLAGGRLSDWIEKWEMPEVSKTLLMARQESLDNWKNDIGVNATTMLESQNLETATEAQTLQDSAANMIAQDQAAVESFQVEVFRKESFINLSRMPKRSVLCVKLQGRKEESEGEFEDEPEKDGYEADPDEEYIFDVPYEEAILLKKGPESVAAAGRIAKAREKVADRASFDASMNGVAGPELDAVKEQAVQQVPQTPEMAARAARGIPMDAVVTIVNPGVEQFIGPEAAMGWEEGLDEQQIQAEVGVSVERGSSSATSRMQAVNEVLMLFNTLTPLLMEMGLYEPIAELINAAIKRSEIPDLDKARVTLQKIEQAVQQKQQAAQQQAQAEAEAKAQASQGPSQLTPDTAVKAEAEIHKSDTGLQTQQEKTKQQELKLMSDQVKGDAARDRTRSEAQLQMGAVI